MPLKLALGVTETVAGRRLHALEGGGGGGAPLLSNASLGGGGAHPLKEALGPGAAELCAECGRCPRGPGAPGITERDMAQGGPEQRSMARPKSSGQCDRPSPKSHGGPPRPPSPPSAVPRGVCARTTARRRLPLTKR